MRLGVETPEEHELNGLGGWSDVSVHVCTWVHISPVAGSLLEKVLPILLPESSTLSNDASRGLQNSRKGRKISVCTSIVQVSNRIPSWPPSPLAPLGLYTLNLTGSYTAVKVQKIGRRNITIEMRNCERSNIRSKKFVTEYAYMFKYMPMRSNLTHEQLMWRHHVTGHWVTGCRLLLSYCSSTRFLVTTYDCLFIRTPYLYLVLTCGSLLPDQQWEWCGCAVAT